MADVPFVGFAFKTALGGTVTDTRVVRTMPTRLSDIVNVKDWGAIGNFIANDRAAIQAAIDYAKGTRLDGSKGGRVFFPPGKYRVDTTGLNTGTEDPEVTIELIGAARTACIVQGNVSGWMISPGTSTYDAAVRIEDLTINNENVTLGNGAVLTKAIGGSIKSCECVGWTGIDASAANGVSVYDNSGTKSMFLGNNCCAVNCRTSGAGIMYSLSGYGAAVISCSIENANVGCRVGWGPSGETPAIGCTVQGLQTERATTALELYNAQGCLVQGNFLSGGTGVMEVQGTAASGGWVWNSGTHVVTVTTKNAHGFAAGLVGVLLEADDGSLQATPGGWRETDFTYVTRHATDPKVFTYPGPLTNPGSPPTSSFGEVGWKYALEYSLRCRKVSDSVIIGNECLVNAIKAAIDLDYDGDVNTIQSNNVLAGTTPKHGFIMPSNRKNLAGWHFSQCGVFGISDNPGGFTGAAPIVPHPFAKMRFNDLPGQTPGSFQPGPIEGQEYDIIDSTIAASGNFAAAVTSGTGTTGSHVRVRYDGANWRIVG